MRNIFIKPTSIALLLSLFVFSSGCDTSKDEDASESFDQMGDMIESAFSIFGDVAVDILANSTAKSQPILDCEQSGTVNYITTTSPDQYSLTLDDCNGIDGDVNLGLVTDISETGISFGLSLDGNLTEACSMTLNNFSMNITSTQTGDSEIVLGGGIASTCNGEAFSCTFNNDALTTGSENALVQQKCSGTVG